ncbi:MAG: (d)CMP kinase [Bacteroidota bacterium]
MKSIIIAIDGYSACGKSSTAKLVARTLGYHFIDSGAMYRAVTLFFLKNDVSFNYQSQVEKALESCRISFDGLSTLLNDEDVTNEIRLKYVDERVSEVSAISMVREKMVACQHDMGKKKNIVMDGRDIGTVVFPDAELKLFMTADIKVRVERRRRQLERQGVNMSGEDIERNLLERDLLDSTRDDSPLRKAEDATEIDTTELTLEKQSNIIVEMAQKLINEN